VKSFKHGLYGGSGLLGFLMVYGFVLGFRVSQSHETIGAMMTYASLIAWPFQAIVVTALSLRHPIDTVKAKVLRRAALVPPLGAVFAVLSFPVIFWAFGG